MPHLNFKNIERNKVKQLCNDLTAQLAKVIECPEDWITFNHIDSQTFVQGVENDEIVFVNVEWFPRTQEVQDKVASIIHNGATGTGAKEVVIIFHDLKKESYYEEGQHF